MNTEEIMQLSLDLAGLRRIPEDSSIYVRGHDLRRILFCLDAGVSEIQLAKNLSYDALIAHHPQGEGAVVHFHEVFRRHIPQMVDAGVPRRAAEDAVKGKLQLLEVQGHMRSYSSVVDVAKLLKVPFMNIHTPLDEVGRRRMMAQVACVPEGDASVADVVSALEELGEYKRAVTKIKVRLGRVSNAAGNVGGTGRVQTCSHEDQGSSGKSVERRWERGCVAWSWNERGL
jgi:hypothetical protein